ncbi:uncharacterized protein M421DRAFT_390033, partial [Didymella exigua CBS 183.55]
EGSRQSAQDLVCGCDSSHIGLPHRQKTTIESSQITCFRSTLPHVCVRCKTKHVATCVRTLQDEARTQQFSGKNWKGGNCMRAESNDCNRKRGSCWWPPVHHRVATADADQNERQTDRSKKTTRVKHTSEMYLEKLGKLIPRGFVERNWVLPVKLLYWYNSWVSAKGGEAGCATEAPTSGSTTRYIYDPASLSFIIDGSTPSGATSCMPATTQPLRAEAKRGCASALGEATA